MNPNNKRLKQSNSLIFVQKKPNQQLYLPWYCSFCYNPEQEHKQPIASFSSENHNDMNNLSKNKLRHSLKRSININNKQLMKSQKTIKNQTIYSLKEMTQSIKQNQNQRNNHPFNYQHTRNFLNKTNPTTIMQKQNFSSAPFYKKSLIFDHSLNFNSINSLKTNPQLNIQNIHKKNDYACSQKFSTLKSINFTESPKNIHQDSQRPLFSSNNNVQSIQCIQSQEKNKKNHMRILNSMPILQLNKQNLFQLQQIEQIQKKTKDNFKIKYFKSDISTKQDFQKIPQSSKLQNQIQLASSTQSFLEFNILPPKKKISIKSSNSFNQNGSGDIKSSLSQIGIKKKIGIRKVQSIVSNQDEDQFSEVIYGERNFLMPQIHQVQELSRVSSRESLDMKINQI